MYLVLGILVTLLGIASSASSIGHVKDSSCPSDWVHAEKEGCFKFLSSEANITWLDSQYACEREGGYLAEPKTLGQMEFLTGIASLQESFFGIKFWWIGLDDIGMEGVWTWQHSREEASQVFWDDGSPSGQSDNQLDCVYVQLNEGHLSWKDEDCRIKSVGSLSIAPICQRDVSTPDLTTTTRRPASTTKTGWPTEPATQTSTEWPTTGCPDAWSEFEGSCFLFVLKSTSWLESRENCHSMGAELASIHSLEQNNFINGLMSAINLGDLRYWLGGTDSHAEGNWTWSDGSPWNIELFGGYIGGVERNCLAKYEGPWFDLSCAKLFSFLCQK